MAVSCSQQAQQGTSSAFPKNLLQNSGGLWTKYFVVPPKIQSQSSDQVFWTSASLVLDCFVTRLN